MFIAPSLHQDTIETFWNSVKHGYQGKRQNIIPLSVDQFVKLLRVLLKVKNEGKEFKHDQLLKLYKSIMDVVDVVDSSVEWIERIPKNIKKWQRQILK